MKHSSGWSPLGQALLAGHVAAWTQVLGQAVQQVRMAGGKLRAASSRQRLFAVRLACGEWLEVRAKWTTAYETQVLEGLGEQIPLEIPKLIYGEQSGAQGLCLLENLPPGKRLVDWSRTDAEAALVDLAKLHAAFWDVREAAYPWLAGLRAQCEVTCARGRRGARLLRQMGGWPGMMDGARLAQMEALLSEPARLLAPLDGLPLTLVHGDSWQPNWLLLGERRVLLDWQTAAFGPGLWDVVYFLEMSGEAGGRVPLTDDDALRVYLDALEGALGRPLGEIRELFEDRFAAVSVIQTVLRWPGYAVDYLEPLERHPWLAKLWRGLPVGVRSWVTDKAAWTEKGYYQEVFDRFDRRVLRFTVHR